ncbi:thioredoxin family protein [Psychroflexus planctonicus]|nr:thioredoxin fold domain-containing protein [Psychroflexus planctonicus]
MKKLVILAIVLVSFFGLNAQNVNWMSMNEALAAQEKEPKKIFMDAYTDWCGPCKTLDKKTLNHPKVAAYLNKHFYPVKFNAEGTEKIMYKDFEYTNPNHDPNRKGRNAQHFLANALNISAYPTLVFFDEEGEVIAPVVGYKTPEQLELYLKMIKSDDYKEITTAEDWEAYQKGFKSTF